MLALQAHAVANWVLLTEAQLPTGFIVGVGLQAQLRLHAGALIAKALQQIKSIGERLVPKTVVVVVKSTINSSA